MAIQLQLRRGTNTENNTFIGAEGEVTVDTTEKTLRLHDNSTLGGIVIDKSEDLVHKGGTETITGSKTFSISPNAPTPDSSDNSTKVATTAFVNSKFVVTNTIPSSGIDGTIYFVY